MTAPATSFDPDLESLPDPPRPWRRLTLAAMALTAVASLWLSLGLGASVKYALSSGGPTELGRLELVKLSGDLNNRWVHGVGEIESTVIEYRRPLDADTFRLARVRGAPNLWVELRIPGDLDPRHYVPPVSFVGRLMRMDRVGLRHRAIVEAAHEAAGAPRASDGWLLVDGEAPADDHWVLGVVLLLFCFAGFNVWGIMHLSRPVRDA